MAAGAAGDKDETGPVSTPDHESTFPRIDNVRILGTTEDPRAEIRGCLIRMWRSTMPSSKDNCSATCLRPTSAPNGPLTAAECRAILQPPSARQGTVNQLDKFELEREVKEGKRVLFPSG